MDVIPIQLPGRENRVREQIPGDFDTIMDAMVAGLQGELNQPYVLFGHSMGALMAYELARRVNRKPEHLILAGRRGPRIAPFQQNIHDLDDASFIQLAMEGGGSQQALFANPELLRIMMTRLRADYRLCATYRHQPEQSLEIPITLFLGDDDPHNDSEDLGRWDVLTSGSYQCKLLPGGHFFINTHREALLKELNTLLAPTLETFTIRQPAYHEF